MNTTWIDKFTRGFFWFGFCVFLGASIPHLAAYFRHFDPNVVVGSFEDIKNWVVSYLIAIVIDVTDVLVSVAVMKAMKNGAKMRDLAGYWAFIVFIMVISWLINWQYNIQFASPAFAKADAVKIFGGDTTIGVINPIIGSAFQLLVLVYTAMAHKLTAKTTSKTAEELKKEADELEALAGQQARIDAVKRTQNANKIGGVFDTLGQAKERAKKLFEKSNQGAQIEHLPAQESDHSTDQSTAQNVRTEVITEPINQIDEQEPVKLIEQPQNERQQRLHVVKPDLDQEKLAKVRRVLKKEPDISDRQLAQKAGMAPATAKRYRAQLSVSEERNRA